MPSQNQEKYSKIWKLLNQINCPSINEEIFSDSQKIEPSKVKQYFTKNSQYKTIKLDSLSKEDKQTIDTLQLSLNYLELNLTAVITKEGTFSEEPNHVEQIDLPSRVAEVFQKTKFQLSILEEHYIYAICPSTGKLLKSNRSFAIGDAVFYRFVGNEVFYLVVDIASLGYPKSYLYFPKTELIIISVFPGRDRKTDIDQLKTYVVTNWKSVNAYLLNRNQPEKVALIQRSHFAHHLWNELSGIYKLHDSNLLGNIDRFLVLAEPFGKFDKIFSEISLEKIRRIKREALFKESLEKNYFLIKFGLNYIKENLADRIYTMSFNQCSSAFIAEVEEAKKKHFPLLWVTIRLGDRTWVSQTEGIANILRKMAESFPNLGVVIDGFSLPYGYSYNSKIEKIIKNETDIVRQIKSLLPTGIKVYDIVGCMIYEAIVWAYAIDLYLAHKGTLQHKVGWTANKPGIVHSNKKATTAPIQWNPALWARENSLAPILIPEHYITDVTEIVNKNRNAKDLNNYDCSWEVIYEEVFKLASSIKKSKRNLYP